MKYILLLFCYMVNILCLNIPYTGKNNIVILNLEKFNNKPNLLHIGISFIDDKNNIRFDFRHSNRGKSYITNIEKTNVIYDDFLMNLNNISNTYHIINNKNDTEKKNIFFGITEKTQKEILEFEKNKLIQKKYILGIYDCRHYVNDFTIWCLRKKTPIWKLYKLWEDN